MLETDEDKEYDGLFKHLKIDCGACFGLCCVALYFSTSEGFPANKDAGKPCINLQSDFSCAVHHDLRNKGLKGCTAYDCFGAGQKIAKVTYKGKDWRKEPKVSKQMFETFLIMRQLHEMLWYLTQAFTLEATDIIKDDLYLMMKQTEQLTNLEPDSLMKLDIDAHRTKVNLLLRQVSERVRAKVCQNNKASGKKNLAKGFSFIGADLRKVNLIGADFGGALLIAANLKGTDLSGANLIAADLRDADIRGANLSNSLFLTQAQINVARGDDNTKLPKALSRPTYWEK